MRRTDREINGVYNFAKVMEYCDACRIGIHDGNHPYVIPFNYGYSIDDSPTGKKISLYIHTADEGKQVDLIKKNPNVGFEMDYIHKIATHRQPCRYDCLFASIIGKGTVQILTDHEDKARALNHVAMKYMGGRGMRANTFFGRVPPETVGGYYEFPEEDQIKFPVKALAELMVYKINVKEITGKTSMTDLLFSLVE